MENTIIIEKLRTLKEGLFTELMKKSNKLKVFQITLIILI